MPTHNPKLANVIGPRWINGIICFCTGGSMPPAFVLRCHPERSVFCGVEGSRLANNSDDKLSFAVYRNQSATRASSRRLPQKDVRISLPAHDVLLRQIEVVVAAKKRLCATVFRSR